MKAMILAAGRGERMRPLTDHTPKPLLPLNQKPIIAHTLLALANAGVKEIIINTAYLADQIHKTLGNGNAYGVNITYSFEPEALDVAGGVKNALPLLGDDPFILISADIFSEFDFSTLTKHSLGNQLGHMILTPTPDYIPNSDYDLANGKIYLAPKTYSYAGICLVKPQLFADLPGEKITFLTAFSPAIQAEKISGEIYKGVWMNIGTQAILEQANAHFEKN